ncbi:MAG: hypothetical protein PHT02_07020 [Tissierellia bacterium]|nr:hypothetical protein [Tissierellia bacterium]
MADTNQNNNYIRIPNIIVQNIKDNSNGNIDNSYIQLFKKRTLVYFYNLLELENRKGYIIFSINMIIHMMNISDKAQARERNYLRDFLVSIHKNNLITLSNDIDLVNLKSDKFIKINLNLYKYNEKGQVQKYFELYESEYNKIMNDYSGKLDKFNLLNLFCNIKSRIYRNRDDVSCSEKLPEVCYPSYQTICDDIFIESDKTLRKYIDCLVDLDLIRFDCAGDMTFDKDGQQPVRRKANFTYALFAPGWETELENAIAMFKSQKRKVGWSFLSKPKEIDANVKRSITQKINKFQKLKDQGKLTQGQNKELQKLERQKLTWKNNDDVDIRQLEEDKLLKDNPGKPLSEVYEELGYGAKAERAWEDESDAYDTKTLIEYLDEIDLYSDDIKKINNHEMTVKEFFDNIYIFADYSEFEEYRSLPY